MEVITSNIVTHANDRPEFVNVLDNNRIFVWAERVCFRIYCTMDCYSCHHQLMHPGRSRGYSSGAW